MMMSACGAICPVLICAAKCRKTPGTFGGFFRGFWASGLWAFAPVEEAGSLAPRWSSCRAGHASCGRACPQP
eukprot:9755362-Alexandrium_andersonii.AAC.1